MNNDEQKNFKGVTLLVADDYDENPLEIKKVDDFNEVNANNPALIAVSVETYWDHHHSLVFQIYLGRRDPNCTCLFAADHTFFAMYRG